MSSFSDGMVTTNNTFGWTSEIVNQISLKFIDYSESCGEVLDIGAAFGVASLPAIKRGASLIANDFDQVNLDILRSRIPDELQSHLRTIQGWFPRDLDFEPNSLGAVHASNVLHFLSPDEIEDGLQKVLKWLKPGGRFFVVTSTPYQLHLSSLIPIFEERKADGCPWPGFFDLRQHEIQSEFTRILPTHLLLMDEESGREVFTKAGFHVDVCNSFRRQGLPPAINFDGRENLGLIASKC